MNFKPRWLFGLCAVVISVLFAASCAKEIVIPTISGPESKGLAHDFCGELLFDEPVGGLVCVSFPSKKVNYIRQPGKAPGTVHSVAGPDTSGRVAIIENHMRSTESYHCLKVYRFQDESDETTVFKKTGDALWDHVVGHCLALSPTNGRIALVADTTGVQVKNPDAYLTYGTLEVWEIDRKQKIPISCKAVDEGLSWFPDGKHLAYVDLVDIPTALNVHRLSGVRQEGYAKSILNWQHVPIVKVLDLSTGLSASLSVGWKPVVSAEGDSVLMSDYYNNMIVISTNSTFLHSISLPGIIYLGPIYFDKSKVLYWGLPTEGMKLKTTDHNSPLVGSKPMYTLKVTDLNSGQFETVIDYIDPRRCVSFGRIK